MLDMIVVKALLKGGVNQNTFRTWQWLY